MSYIFGVMNDLPLPSEAELVLLRALWDEPGATVQAVHERTTAAGKAVGYTTVLTQLQRMLKKGLVSRERRGKQHFYRAAVERAATEAALVERMSKTAFGGSAVRLALRALGDSRPTRAELDELSRWLDAKKEEE